LIDDVLVSLSIYHSIEASNLGVFSSVLDEALDFLLAILEVTAATFQLKSQVRFYFFNQAFGFTAAIRLLVFHVTETVHNTIEACAHLVTRISDIRIRFVTQIAKTSFRSETVVKDFPTNTGNIFCYPTDFLSNSTSSIRDIFVDTCLCFLNRRFYFLNVSFGIIDFVLYGNCSSTKATTYQCTPDGTPSRAPTGIPVITIITASVRDYNAIASTFYFYSHNFMGFRKLIIKFLGSLI
jgi:hypothetical protein